jgi:hypothetical protein
VPAVVGVPLILITLVVDAEGEIPGGSPLIVQVKGAVPLPAIKVALYDCPTCPDASADGDELTLIAANTGLLRNGSVDTARIATSRKRNKCLQIYFIKIGFILLSSPSLCLIIHPNS